MPDAYYFRQQAHTCARLALATRDEGVAERFDQPSAEDDHFGIENIGETRDPDGEVLGGAIDRADDQLVSLSECLGQVAAGRGFGGGAPAGRPAPGPPRLESLKVWPMKAAKFSMEHFHV